MYLDVTATEHVQCTAQCHFSQFDLDASLTLTNRQGVTTTVSQVSACARDQTHQLITYTPRFLASVMTSVSLSLFPSISLHPPSPPLSLSSLHSLSFYLYLFIPFNPLSSSSTLPGEARQEGALGERPGGVRRGGEGWRCGRGAVLSGAEESVSAGEEYPDQAGTGEL